MKTKACLVCSEPILQGRTDKRYCSDHCRSTFHNRLNSDQTNFIRNVNNTLRRNRRILSELNPEGKRKIHRDALLEKGFNFSYFTNLYRTRSGDTYYFCYDHGYRVWKGGYLMLVMREQYVE